MTQKIALFSDDDTLRDMLNQLEDCEVGYFSPSLDLDRLPNNITLAVFDFDGVPLSLLDEWEQFPRLHLRKMAVVSTENLHKVDAVLERLDNYVVRPLSKKSLIFRIEQITGSETIDRDYMAVVRSEVFTPLTTISGYSELMLSDKYSFSPEKILEFIQIIWNSVERSKNLIHYFVDWVRIENGTRYYFESFDLKELVQNIRADISSAVSDKSQQLSITIPDDVKIYGDRYKILQVIEMVLDNASKYSYEETEIEMSCAVKSGFLQCKVQDRGIGISKDFYPKVFDKWHRGENKLVWDSYGLGASLYLCKQIIEMHGGRIWFESEVGVGATFYFTLPLAE